MFLSGNNSLLLCEQVRTVTVAVILLLRDLKETTEPPCSNSPVVNAVESFVFSSY